MHVIHPFSLVSLLPRSFRVLALYRSQHSRHCRSVCTSSTFIAATKMHYIFSAKKSKHAKNLLSNCGTLTRNALSWDRAFSSSSAIDAAPQHLPDCKQVQREAVNLKFDKLKELSYFVIQRSPTRHFSQVCLISHANMQMFIICFFVYRNNLTMHKKYVISTTNVIPRRAFNTFVFCLMILPQAFNLPVLRQSPFLALKTVKSLTMLPCS